MSLDVIITFLFLSIYLPICHCITKSISLTPNDHGSSSITLLKGGSLHAPFQWDLLAVDEVEFNMKIHLNKSWSFHNKYPTKLTFEIGSDTTTSSSLIVSFSQNNAKYITSVIQIGGDDDHFIYPPSNGAKQSYGDGNIEELVSQQKGSRIDKATNNGSYGYFEPMTPRPNISYPLQFIIENHPDFDYMIFTYSNHASNPRNVVYYAMDPDLSLDIYLSAGDEGDNFDITYFNIMYTVSETLETPETPLNDVATAHPDSTETADIAPHYITDTANWFERALVIILISTVAILCCLFLVFGAMFAVILNNHKSSIKKMVTNKKEIEIIHPPHIHQRASSIKSSTTFTATCSPPSNDTLSSPTVFSANIHPTMMQTSKVPSSHPSPALNDILAVLSPKLSTASTRSQRSVGTPQCQRDVNIVYNDLRDRRSTINTNGEMDDDDHISEENAHDHEMEAMYAPPSKADIRRATMPSTDTTPGFGDALPLHVDDGVNRVSIVNLGDVLPKLAISINNLDSSDSDRLYDDTGNEEGTPFGSTDTQTDYGAVTPYAMIEQHSDRVLV